MEQDKEFLFLSNNIHILIAEWIPFGTSDLELLANKLLIAGKNGAMFTDIIDKDPDSIMIEADQPETYIQIKDHLKGEYINFTGELRYLETGADIQREILGVHLDSLGRIAYGIKLEETDSVNNFSFDKISRIMHDIITDTSKMMDTILNNYQKRFLEIIFLEEYNYREKFSIITANKINPNLKSVKEYLSKSEYRSEISQLVNVILEDYCHEITQDDKIICGSNGIILISNEVKKYEKILYLFGMLKSIELFQNNLSARLSKIWDEIKKIKNKVKKGSGKILDLQVRVNDLIEDIALFEVINSYIEVSIKGIRDDCKIFKNNFTKDEINLEKILKIDDLVNLNTKRIIDTKPIIEGLNKEINGLRSLVSSLSERETNVIFKSQEKLSAQNLAIGEALEFLEVILFGIYMIEVIHLVINLSNSHHFLVHTTFLGITLGIWVILIAGIIGIVVGRYLIRRIKSKTFKKEYKEW